MQDSLFEELRTTKKETTVGNVTIPAGSFYGYIVQDGGECETLFRNKTKAIRDYQTSKKNFPELSVSIVYYSASEEFLEMQGVM